MYGSSQSHHMSADLVCSAPPTPPLAGYPFLADWHAESYFGSGVPDSSFFGGLSHVDGPLSTPQAWAQQSAPWHWQGVLQPLEPPPGLALPPGLAPPLVAPPASLLSEVEADSEPDVVHSSACSTADTETDQVLGSADVGILGSEALPTVGSLKHSLGICKPCAFVFKEGPGCTSGVECTFCHLCEPGEKKRRVKSRKWQHQQSKVKSRCPCDSICMPWLHVETKSF
eukprot:TRINITY_DN1001_c0_g1_i3.p1 TRINITY_DN1001_c0_g1~~TRINITY_DN1001_c0_g1_i3.p1  ORF type:complete len:227 (+),score=38.43 TRINITY_DN1001_c0_g1_i3:89-769(+)